MQDFRFSSKSSDKIHTATLFSDGAVKCSCRGYIFNRKCWHVDAVKEEVMKDKKEADSWKKDKNTPSSKDDSQLASSSGKKSSSKPKEDIMADGKKARFTTKHGYDVFVLLSAFHKCVRRGMEYEACHYAIELASNGKSSFSMVVNYIETIVHEDIGVGDMQAATYVMTTCKHMREYYERKRELPDMALCNAIAAMCRAAKDHTGTCLAMIVMGEQSKFGCVPKIPDFVYDMHTQQGRKLGRGKQHFLDVSLGDMKNPVPDEPWRAEWERGFLEGWSVDPDDMEPPPRSSSPTLFDELGEQ